VSIVFPPRKDGIRREEDADTSILSLVLQSATEMACLNALLYRIDVSSLSTSLSQGALAPKSLLQPFNWKLIIR